MKTKYARQYGFLLSLFLLLSCQGKSERTVLVIEPHFGEFGGKVKQIIEYDCKKYFNAEFPYSIDKSSCEIKNVYKYNIDEVLIEDLSWSWNDYPDKPDYRKVKTVDKYGNILVENSTKLASNNNYPFMVDMAKGYNIITTNTYNQDGFRVEQVVMRNGELQRRVEYIRDEYNCLTKEIQFDNENEVSFYIERKFDNKNRMVEYVFYDGETEDKEKTVYKYGKSAKWEIMKEYDSNGYLVETTSRKDVIESNMIDYSASYGLPYNGYKDVEYYSDGNVRSWHYINNIGLDHFNTYDRNGETIEHKSYNGDEWQDTYTWKYREDGALIEESEATSRIVGKNYYKKTTYYKVDHNGNWIEKQILDNEGNMLEGMAREIEYY